MTTFTELRQRLLHRYYVLHLMYGCGYLYVSFKRLRDPNVEFTDAERNAHLALFGFSVWKAFMANTAEELASVLILYTKFFSFCMIYWKHGMGYSALYLIGWFTLSTLFPQPWYQGPTKITELSQEDLRTKVKGSKDKKPSSKYWVVMLYANWSLACLNFEAVLAKLSLKYSAEHIHFGKLDIDIYGDVAEEYGISRDPASFDLPALLLFRDGALIRRLPELTVANESSSAARTAKDTITRIGWSKKAATVVQAFHLDKILVEK
ncbi:hypothetical protein K492DRAFT_12351 [Lichtheimia hyalospora FSU 10163]|nr:hypothetical protein K492DRAFT_12351 [Lichtheimia hyalospora FSU 10163]